MARKSMQLGLILFIFNLSVTAEIVESRPVGPGVMYYHEFRAAGPWHLYVLEIELTNQWTQLETVTSEDRVSGYEKTSSMAARKDHEGHQVIGAVNGDFYMSGGIPTNTQILQGEMLKRADYERAVFAASDSNEPLIGIYTYTGEIFCQNDSTAVLDGINESRGTDQIILYNRYYGNTTGTNQYGTEIMAQYISDPIANDTVYLKVTAMDSIHTDGHGNNTIPDSGLVLSGHGISADFLKDYVTVGDTLGVLLKFAGCEKRIKELVGGNPVIITNRSATVPGGSFSSDRHPRTAVGFSQDSTVLYMFVVDGRQTGFSVGMSLYELADYMLEWGVYNGINLDGGGSSAMVVRNEVKNSPSDAGGERSVANALMVVSTALTGELAHLRITPREVFLLKDTQKQFQVTGFDQYYNDVQVQTDQLVWTCDTSLGSITSEGLFTAGDDTCSGFVTVVLDSVMDSVRVYVTDIASIFIQPDPIILKVGEQQQLTAETRDYFGNVVDLDTDQYDWSVTADIGTISTSGLFTATAVGEGAIIAAYDTVSGSASVSVGASVTVILDSFDNVNNWSLTGLRVDLDSCSLTILGDQYVSDPTSSRLAYKLTTGGTSVLYMDCGLPISGTPNAVGIHVYGDGKGHWLRGEFQDKDSEKFLVDFTSSDPGIDWQNSWKYLEVLLEDAVPSWSNPAASLNYPITWTKIYLAEVDDNKKDSGVIYLDDFTAQFVETDIEVEKGEVNPSATSFQLQKHYPNPFNNSSRFKIKLYDKGDVTFIFYDINGKEVDRKIVCNQNPGTQIIKWAPKHLPSGIYLYTIHMKSTTVTSKCLLLK